MGNKSSRTKEKKCSKIKPSSKTRSLSSLPQSSTCLETIPTKPTSQSVIIKKKHEVRDEGGGEPELRNVTKHKRQSTAPEIDVQSTPRSLKLTDFSKVVHHPEPGSDGKDEDDLNILIEDVSEPAADELCQICSVFTGKIKFLCRVCYQVYHLGCLQKIEQHQPSPVVCYIKRADTELGWSCSQCDNLSRLLTESEMALLTYTLEQYNIKQDTPVYRQQYLYYKRANYRETNREEITDDQLADERNIFDKLDTKHTGHIPWSQFINSEAVHILKSHSKNKLARLLTPGELYRCRQKFLIYDHDRDGEITRFESIKAQMQAYCELGCFPTPNPSKLFYTNEEIGGVIKWMEFVRDQALTIIAGRRNSFCKEPPKPCPEIITDDVLITAKDDLTETVPPVNTTMVTPKSSPNTPRKFPSPSRDRIESQSIKNQRYSSADSSTSTRRVASDASDLSANSAEILTNRPHLLMRYGRSKSTVVHSTANQRSIVPTHQTRTGSIKSADYLTMDDAIIPEPNLRKVPNVDLLQEEVPPLIPARSPNRNSSRKITAMANTLSEKDETDTVKIKESSTQRSSQPTSPASSKSPVYDNTKLPLPGSLKLPVSDNTKPSIPGKLKPPVSDNTQLPHPENSKLPVSDNTKPPHPKKSKPPVPDNTKLPLPESSMPQVSENAKLPLPENLKSQFSGNQPDQPNKDKLEGQEDENMDVVRRYPKVPRKQTMSWYIYESNRRVSTDNEIRSIRRPVSVVGFKIEPTDLVSKLSVNLTRPASAVIPARTSLPIPTSRKCKELKLNDKENQQPKLNIYKKDGSIKAKTAPENICVETTTPDKPTVGTAPPEKICVGISTPEKSWPSTTTPEKRCLSATTQERPGVENTTPEKSRAGTTTPEKPGVSSHVLGVVEIREKIMKTVKDITSNGKFRASDSEVLKSTKSVKSQRGQTTSLFVTKNERAFLNKVNRDHRPISLG